MVFNKTLQKLYSLSSRTKNPTPSPFISKFWQHFFYWIALEENWYDIYNGIPSFLRGPRNFWGGGPRKKYQGAGPNIQGQEGPNF